MAAGDYERDSFIGGNGWNSRVEIRQLRAFLAVVERGSVSAAAVALGCAQSTLSEALAALDRAVGVPTVVRRRGAHATSLTTAGEALLPHARRLLQELDASHRCIAAVTHAAAATVDITANESVSTYLLAPALGSLRKRWPNTRFTVEVAACASARSDVARGRCDLGVVLESPADPPGATRVNEISGRHRPTRTVVLAADVALVVFASARHQLTCSTQRGAVPRHELGDFPIFVTDGAGDFHELLRRYLTADGTPAPRLNAVGSVDAVKRAVAADSSSLGVLPDYAVAEELRERRVRAIQLRPRPPRVQLVALLPSAEVDLHPSVTDLLDALRTA